jgi:tetratricopeptide (TPR) repeat protein
MRWRGVALVALSLAWGSAEAADKPLIGPAPAWVKPVSLPAENKADEAPVRLLLADQQHLLEPGRQVVYSEFALKIQTPQGLAAGNLSFPWRPETDEMTVHKLLIRRGGQTIDVLGSGQTFTVVRRETNLENATLDGVLTANIQPEGLQVGDVIEFAASLSSSDPVMKGHVEQIAASWNEIEIGRAHMRVQWPDRVKAKLRQTGHLPAVKVRKADGMNVAELTVDGVTPLVAPKGAPPRYQLGRMVEFTDFESWADLGALMAPLYVKAAAVPAQGPLRTELERIRSLSADPTARAEAALALVQDRVRYVALSMGSGGLVPADAETTWSRRYGDCKGKTALLLALLHELGIEAEPVAVSLTQGDGLDSRLPMVGAFDHVLVRARVAGRTYWLDGTRTGDTSLDRLAVPGFGWGLPLLPKGSALVRMVPEPLQAPSHLLDIRIDARAGLSVPAPTKVETILRGDGAVGTNLALANLAGDARDRALRDYWKDQLDFVEIQSTSATFDKAKGELRLAMTGLARMDWDGDRYETDGTRVGYNADFSRDTGPDRDAPFAVTYPYFSKTVETILLPPGFDDLESGANAALNETVAGIEYRRSARLADNVFRVEKTERSVAPEFPAGDAPAAQARLRELAGRSVTIRKPSNYRPTEQEIAASIAATPTTADGFFKRARMMMELARFDEAIKDFDRAAALDPKDAWTLANRGLAYVWQGKFDKGAPDLDAAAAIDSRNPVVFRARGLMAQMKGNPSEAVAAYTTALEIEPNGFALGRRAEAHWRLGNGPAALADSAAALKIKPDWTDLYLLRVNILRGQGKRQEALAEAEAAALAAPEDHDAHLIAANAYSAMGESARAMKAYERAIALAPDEGYVYLNRGLHRPKADRAGRRADIEAALKLDPELEDALAAKAELQLEDGDFAGAVATYSSAIAASPTPQEARLLALRGIAHSKAGDAARAEKDFAAARSKAAADASALNSLCWVKGIAGIALESALAECDAALAKVPGSSAYLDSRALVLLRMGRIDEAIAEYDRALAANPRQSSSLYGRSVAWARKGDKAKSGADLAAALKVNPDVQTRFEGYGIKL